MVVHKYGFRGIAMDETWNLCERSNIAAIVTVVADGGKLFMLSVMLFMSHVYVFAICWLIFFFRAVGDNTARRVEMDPFGASAGSPKTEIQKPYGYGLGF